MARAVRKPFQPLSGNITQSDATEKGTPGPAKSNSGEEESESQQGEEQRPEESLQLAVAEQSRDSNVNRILEEEVERPRAQATKMLEKEVIWLRASRAMATLRAGGMTSPVAKSHITRACQTASVAHPHNWRSVICALSALRDCNERSPYRLTYSESEALLDMNKECREKVAELESISHERDELRQQLEGERKSHEQTKRMLQQQEAELESVMREHRKVIDQLREAMEAKTKENAHLRQRIMKS